MEIAHHQVGKIEMKFKTENKETLSSAKFKRTLGRIVLTLGISTASVSIDSIIQDYIAVAVEDTYPDSDAVDCSATFGTYSWCKGGSPDSPRGYGYNNCTDWVAYRDPILTEVSIPKGWGHAKNWDNSAIAAGYEVDDSPEVGDIAVWNDGDYGHVEVVESVNANGTVNTSGYNKHGDGEFDTQTGVTADAYIDMDGNGTTGGSNYLGLNDILDATGIEGIGWRVSHDASSAWDDDYAGTTRTKETLLIGDFDRDGRMDDVLDTTGDTNLGWRVSMGANTKWDDSFIGSSTTADSLLVGDFDRDGYMDDVLNTPGDSSIGWRYSEGGKNQWNYDPINSGRTAGTLLVGDFNQDGFMDDILDTTGDPNLGWRVAIGAKGPWDYSFKNSTRGAENMFVGDFDNDGFMDDIFDAGSSVGWRVAYNGKSEWDHENYKNSSTQPSELMVGDFDNDGFIDDVLNTAGPEYGWRTSENGRGGWVKVRNSSRTMETLLLGDFSD